MKFRIQMKDPGGVFDSITDAVQEQVRGIECIDDDERELVAQERRDKLNSLCATWFGYGEYLTVEIDTDANTCVVVPQ